MRIKLFNDKKADSFIFYIENNVEKYYKKIF
jgi:hypothetical protein